MFKRSTDSTGTTMTAYAFGLEEHLSTGTGTNQNNTYYYSLGGRLIGLSKTSGGHELPGHRPAGQRALQL